MNEDFYILLIYSELDGSITPEEQRQLDEWLAADPEHQALMEDLTMAYSGSEDYGQIQAESIDLNAAFAEQLTLIEEDKVPTRKITLREPKSRIPSNQWLRIAAMVAFFVTSIWYLNPTESTPAIVEITATDTENIMLADGSEVTLSEGSELVYPNQFEAEKRVVQLKKGKATFKVTKGKGQFIVENPNGVVTVLGTVFQFGNETNSNMLKLRVTEGKVNIKNKKATKSLDVVANESVVVIGEAMYKTKFGKAPVNYFEFQETPLNIVVAELGWHFDTNIYIDKLMVGCTLTVKFEGKSLKTIVETIGKLLNSKVVKNVDGTYQLNGGDCR